MYEYTTLDKLDDDYYYIECETWSNSDNKYVDSEYTDEVKLEFFKDLADELNSLHAEIDELKNTIKELRGN